jgi:hypothetical protein
MTGEKPPAAKGKITLAMYLSYRVSQKKIRGKINARNRGRTPATDFDSENKAY